MSETIIFKDLPATFPEVDKYSKPSFMTSLLVHAGLLTVLLIVPFFFMETIPEFQLLTELVAPPPPPPAAPPPPLQIVGAPQPPAARPHTPAQTADNALIMPTVVPKEIARIIESPEPFEGIIGVPGGMPGGVAGGVLGGILARNIPQPEPLAAPPPPPPPLALPKVDVDKTYRVGGDVKEPRIIKLVPPKYPALASKARVHGTVVLEATLTKEGTVDEIRVISGHPLLIEAAIDCVKQWRYEPTMLNGEPISIVLTASVHFQQRPNSE